jgi:hypothetical protein
MKRMLPAACAIALCGGCMLVLHGPPAVVVHAKPRLVVVENTELYYAADMEADLFFYSGLWYRPYRGYWYRAEAHAGPWVRISVVPSVFYRIPPGHVKYHCVRVPHRRPVRHRRRHW